MSVNKLCAIHIYFCTSVKSSWPQYSICHRRVFCFEVSLVDGAGYGDGEQSNTVSITISSFAIILHSADAFFLFCKQPWTTWIMAWSMGTTPWSCPSTRRIHPMQSGSLPWICGARALTYLQTVLGQFGTGQFGTRSRTIWHSRKFDMNA